MNFIPPDKGTFETAEEKGSNLVKKVKLPGKGIRGGDRKILEDFVGRILLHLDSGCNRLFGRKTKDWGIVFHRGNQTIILDLAFLSF
jgi:hypothetical protein